MRCFSVEPTWSSMAVVTVRPWSEAAALCNSAETTNVNFHDIFYTTGCLLNCKQRKELQCALSSQPGLGKAGDYKKRKEMRQSYKEVNERYFSLHNLAASIENGCRSCKVLCSILEHVSLVGHPDRQCETNSLYNVGDNFVLRKRVTINNVMETQEIKLFHPQGALTAAVVFWS
jgi:hypothetical protein